MNYTGLGHEVMVAENDRAVLEMLQIRLMVAGYHTSMARTGAAALTSLRSIRPAALIIDLNLPEMSGFEVLEALGSRCGKLPFPTLVMARRPSADDIQRAIRLGARDILVKPFSGADVLDRVARLLRPPAPPRPAAEGALHSAYI